MQKVLLVAVAILFALGVLTSYQKHILDYRVSAITEIEFGQASAIEHREYLLRSCQSGTWKNNGIGSRNVVNGNQACGSGQYSKAYCPSGSQMISGGYSLTRWSGGSGWNSPDDSRPSLNENAWLIYTGGGVTGGTCMTAIALCTSN
ncbi:hypothetical protein H8R37_004504 [Salmonella enterica]|uniref:hypothetical protein n=1 Tax=Citrobacter sp. XY323 TaxID=2976537 RepID=UPI0019B8DF59|nr:hypothetical protein [Citrobacter sp. XY323]EGB9568293.1 hypothetical protein [Salmonella enterica]MCS8554559.1 hypothetical protein [Citrobacter sp. XY323]